MSTTSLTLYLRGGCSLCEVFLSELLPLQGELGFAFRIEEVDRNQEWIERYGERVPVLVDEQGVELCHYFLDPDVVRAYFSSL